jgi:hypothetical protein
VELLQVEEGIDMSVMEDQDKLLIACVRSPAFVAAGAWAP